MKRLILQPALLAALLPALLCSALSGQQSLDELLASFGKERQAMFEKAKGQVEFDQIKTLGLIHATRMKAFLKIAKGADSVNGHLCLADIFLQIGQEAEAKHTLASIDADTAPALALLSAADIAQMLRLTDLRKTWIEKAIAKPAPFADRMAMGMLLVTRLQEIEMGEAVFADAFKKATGDEQKSEVRWFQAEATRMREDLGDGAYEAAMQALAKEFPNTRYGSICKDRIRAMAFVVGQPAIAISGKGVKGEAVALKDFAGKVVLLDFWASWSSPSTRTTKAVKALHAKYAAKGFAVLGISLDEDKGEFTKALTDQGITWSQICDFAGPQTDAALRYNIERIPTQILIGKDGKIAALRLFLEDSEGVQEVSAAIEKALAK